jgi:hypothetical protein
VLDIFLYLFTACTLLSFSVSIADGILFFVLAWLIPSFYYFHISPYPELATTYRLIWFVFDIGLLSSYLVPPRILIQLFKRIYSLTLTPSLYPNLALPFDLNRRLVLLLFAISTSCQALSSLLFQVPEDAKGAIYASQSKSVLPYLINNISSTTLLLVTLLLFFKKYNLTLADRRFLVFTSVILPPFGLLIFSGKSILARLLYDSTELIEPILQLTFLYFFLDLRWQSFLPHVSRFISSFRIYSFYFRIVVPILFVGFVFALFLSSSNVNILDIIWLKISTRADVYYAIKPSSFSRMFEEFGLGYSYFFHPFLKSIGLQAYTMPMGTFLASNYGQIPNFIGGSNVHFPLTMFFLGGSYFLGLISVFICTFIFAAFFRHSKYRLLFFLDSNQPLDLFSLFFYTSIPILLVEPSVWSHRLFFFVISLALIKLVRPSISTRSPH